MSCSKSKTINKATAEQMDLLVEWMFKNRAAANNEPGTLEYWLALTEALNAILGGCTKNQRGWMKTWADLVGTARQNLMFLLDGVRQTPLTPNHVRVLTIMGQEAPAATALTEMEQVDAGHEATGSPSPSVQPSSHNESSLPTSVSSYASGQQSHVQPSARPFATSSASRASVKPTAQRVATKRKPTFCGYEQLFSQLPGEPSTSTASSCSAPPQKRAKLSIAGSSTADVAADRSSKALQLIQNMGSSIADNVMSRFTEVTELQTAMLQSSVEGYLNGFEQRLPGMIRDVLDTMLITPNAEAPVQEQQEEEAGVAVPIAEDGEVLVQADAEEEVEDEEDAFNDCPICHEDIILKAVLRCKHEFCSSCIKKWLKKDKSCPLCRCKVDDSTEDFQFMDGVLVFEVSSDSSN